MGITQLNFEGKTKVEVAIMRLQQFEPPEGYYLAFSGGKDSIVLYDLTMRAEVKFDAHYNATGIDPPELVYFMREHYPGLIVERPPRSIWRQLMIDGLPIRQKRWCCGHLKEYGGRGRKLVTGIRWEESVGRRRRKMVEVCQRDTTKIFVNPIIDWTTDEVWEYIGDFGLDYCQLYDEGFTRLGCVLCPMHTAELTKREIERWPKIAEAWRRAANRFWDEYIGKRDSMAKFSSGDELFEWWISRRSSKTEDAQCVMFE